MADMGARGKDEEKKEEEVMKCKFWDRLPGQYDEHCQCGGDIPFSSDAVLGDVGKLLLEYSQYLHEYRYLDDNWILEGASPIQEFINIKFGNVV